MRATSSSISCPVKPRVVVSDFTTVVALVQSLLRRSPKGEKFRRSSITPCSSAMAATEPR
ncbi:hypothetical protein ElyMa_003669200 [Elysia marginata]|uniref:Uncharacterized protein n=1 Tax=Elysia marginata TaxID=1093978 RepID=A0AAV4EXD1_9GAST|nr:hypothetical protein ElyMa_003669200 [Elysia marginata]